MIIKVPIYVEIGKFKENPDFLPILTKALQMAFIGVLRNKKNQAAFSSASVQLKEGFGIDVPTILTETEALESLRTKK